MSAQKVAPMPSNKLPKAVQMTVNRRAFRIATTDGYTAIKSDLEQRALHLMSQPHATNHEVIAIIEGNHFEQTYARHDFARKGC